MFQKFTCTFGEERHAETQVIGEHFAWVFYYTHWLCLLANPATV